MPNKLINHPSRLRGAISIKFIAVLYWSLFLVVSRIDVLKAAILMQKICALLCHSTKRARLGHPLGVSQHL